LGSQVLVDLDLFRDSAELKLRGVPEIAQFTVSGGIAVEDEASSDERSYVLHPVDGRMSYVYEIQSTWQPPGAKKKNNLRTVAKIPVDFCVNRDSMKKIQIPVVISIEDQRMLPYIRMLYAGMKVELCVCSIVLLALCSCARGGGSVVVDQL
jgi:hypothetical protein